jgi:iron complex outermembrane receptor protein
MPTNPYSRLCLGWAVTLGSLLGASAHAAQATVRGTVQDESGAVLRGATVSAARSQTHHSTSVTTDGRGGYELALEAGAHKLTVAHPGFATEVIELALQDGEARTLDVQLSIAPFSETVTATRAGLPLAAVPQAVSVVGPEDLEFSQRKVSAAEALQGIPGIFVADRHNFSQAAGLQLRVRAPLGGFGLNGLQLYQDGIPLTVADGTTEATNLDLGSAGYAEIVRGPSSVLYGNSAGGAISFNTVPPVGTPFRLEPDVQFGSFGYQRQQVKASGTVGSIAYVANLNRLKTDGFRMNSAAETRRGNVVVRAELSPSTELRGVFNLFDMPFAESPSTLDEQTARNDPTSVRALAFTQGWGESSTQGQGGLTVEHRFARGQVLRASGWGLWRNVWNPIPFRIIDLGREAAGFRSEYAGRAELGAMPIEWTSGFDVSYQRDDRNEFANAGVPPGGGDTRPGDLLLDQLEEVLSLAPFLQVRLELQPRWHLTAGVRYDHYDFNADDRFLSDGDQSGGRSMSATSPMLGINFSATDTLGLYANFATAYQTPRTVELSNRPTGEGGFNQDLGPADLRSFEVGARGSVGKLRYELAGYLSTLDDALISFQRPDEQIFYRNAGKSKRNGAEVMLEWRPSSRARLRAAYTYQDFVLDRFVTAAADFSGNREPGTAPHQLFLGGSYATDFGLRSTAQFRWIDAYPVNNANTVSNWSYQVLDLRVGLDRRWGRVNVRPYFGIDNVFNERYNASTVINAVGNRFFEPAPDRAFYAGISIGAGR